MPGWGGHRGGAPTLSTAVGEEQSGEGHKENVRPIQYMSVRRRHYYGVSKAEESLPAGRNQRAFISREAAFEKGPEGWRDVPGREEGEI